ncbi:MAG: hypothetical protein IPL88_11275 [Rhizobiales bacterium]|nr:hypothetical protein [Hyphomicrobiales bacterium]
MEGAFRAVRLERDRAGRGFALVHFFDPALKLEDWLAYLDARDRPGAGSDVVAIEDSRGYAHALFTHEVEQDLRHGRVLRVQALACSGVPSPVLNAAIVAAAERIARERGCKGVVLEIGGGAGDEDAETGLEASLRGRFEKVASAYYRPLPVGDA